MQIKFRRFTDGYVFGSVNTGAGPNQPIDVWAPHTIAGPPPFVPGVFHKLGDSIIYQFLFWNVLGHPLSQNQHAVADGDATAWYVPVGGGPGISTFAFSEDGDYVLPETPIADVLPPGNDLDPSASSLPLSDVALAITAESSAKSLPSALFDGWIQFGSAAINGPTLNVPAHGGTYAIAAYRTPTTKFTFVPVLYYQPPQKPDPTLQFAGQPVFLAPISR